MVVQKYKYGHTKMEVNRSWDGGGVKMDTLANYKIKGKFNDLTWTHISPQLKPSEMLAVQLIYYINNFFEK